LKWHLIIFKSEVERSLRFLEDIRKEEVKIAGRSRKQGKEPKEGPKEVYYKSSEVPSAFKLSIIVWYMILNMNQYK